VPAVYSELELQGVAQHNCKPEQAQELQVAGHTHLEQEQIHTGVARQLAAALGTNHSLEEEQVGHSSFAAERTVPVVEVEHRVVAVVEEEVHTEVVAVAAEAVAAAVVVVEAVVALVAAVVAAAADNYRRQAVLNTVVEEEVVDEQQVGAEEVAIALAVVVVVPWEVVDVDEDHEDL